MTLSRRALFGLVAGGAAAAAWGAADARSGARWTCSNFPDWVDGWDAIVRARVLTSTPIAGAEDALARDVTARAVVTVTGAPREGRTYAFRSQMSDHAGAPIGYLPKVGETVVLMLNDGGRDDDDWTVGNLWPAAGFDRLARRCRLY